MKILSKPKGNAEEYGKWSVNAYVGCSHGCSYCYLKSGVWRNNLGGNKPQLKKGIIDREHAEYVAMTEILANREQIIDDGGVFLSFTSDPLLQVNPFFFTTHIAKECSRYGIPVTILTKVGTSSFLSGKMDGISVFFGGVKNLSMGWTLTGCDLLEMGADSNDERIALMTEFRRWLSPMFVKIWASIEPVVEFDKSFEVIKKALDAGCEHFKIGLLTKNTKVCRGPLKIGEKEYPAYDKERCKTFIHDVMHLIQCHNGKATVYWKQSVRDFLGEKEFATATVGYMYMVGKDWQFWK